MPHIKLYTVYTSANLRCQQAASHQVCPCCWIQRTHMQRNTNQNRHLIHICCEQQATQEPRQTKHVCTGSGSTSSSEAHPSMQGYNAGQTGHDASKVDKPPNVLLCQQQQQATNRQSTMHVMQPGVQTHADNRNAHMKQTLGSTVWHDIHNQGASDREAIMHRHHMQYAAPLPPRASHVD
jgi:hypothetical protein